jgi:hypothetical protein
MYHSFDFITGTAREHASSLEREAGTERLARGSRARRWKRRHVQIAVVAARVLPCHAAPVETP